MILTMLQSDQISLAIKSALSALYIHDAYLIENKVNERTIVNRFSIYFQVELGETGFSEFNMDVEYNRDHSDIKRTVKFPRGTYPDVIVHKRGSNEQNLCVIEFKPWWRKGIAEIEHDIQKLKDFTDQSDGYKYGVGVFIIFGKKTPFIQIINDGQITDTYQLEINL